MNLNKEDVIHKNIDSTIDYINIITSGFIPNDKDICRINVLNIIYHICDIFDDLDDAQKENITNVYNTINLN